MKIISQKKNPFLHREEFVVELESPSHPTFDEVRKLIGKDEALTVVKKIYDNFGRRVFKADAVVYDSAENMKKIETVSRKTRKAAVEAAKTAATAAAGNPVVPNAGAKK